VIGPPAPGPAPERTAARGGTPERAGRLLAAAAENGQAAVVAYSNARHFLAEADPVWWLTRFKPMGECLAMVAPSGEVDLVVTPGWDLARASEAAPDANVQAGDPLAALAAWRARTGLTGGEIAFWGEEKATAERAGVLADVLGPVAVSDAAFEQVARQRDAADIALAEQAATLAVDGYHELLRILRPGIAEFEAIARLHLYLRERGADDTFLLISASRHNLALHPPTERILAPGDVVLCEISPAVGGVYSQICRTVVLGPAGQAIRGDFELLSAALTVGAGACRPGAQVSAVVETMDAVIGAGGFADYCRPPHMRARGHGLGLASAMPGDLTRRSHRQLVAGDVFVLHPNQYLPGSGYLLCGEPLAVTPAGGVPLTGGFASLAEVC
jgi:Xaa-Pro dipeptidase